MLFETKLAAMMSDDHLNALVKLGEVIQLAAGEVLFRIHESPNYLYITLDGGLHLTPGADERLPIWVGPGDFIGEIGFMLGTRRTKTAKAGAAGCTLWRISRSRLQQVQNIETCLLLTHFLIALAPYVKVRKQNFFQSTAAEPDRIHDHCDHTHPAIVRLASRLQRANQWDTAVAIWELVRAMPYRFGFWNVKASETLRLGYGMCTTKANLQVALMRAGELEGAFAELKVDSLCVSLLLPKGYRSAIPRQIKHYFAAVKLDGRWFPCDASFTPQSMPLVVSAIPEFEPYAHYTFRPGAPYNIVGEASGRDPFDFQPLPDLARVMDKRPDYDADNFEAMNVLLDKAQGAVHPLPEWAALAKQLLQNAPAAAFHKALAGIKVEMLELFAVIRSREAGRIAEDEKKIIVVSNKTLGKTSAIERQNYLGQNH